MACAPGAGYESHRIAKDNIAAPFTLHFPGASHTIDMSPTYLVSVVVLLLILPAASVVIEAVASAHGMSIMSLIGKWYVFWACGIRLLLAGIRQVSQPRFTAAEIFNLDNIKAFPIVREIGFGNLAMGTLGISTIFRPAWLVPAAGVGGLYYGLAGLGHDALGTILFVGWVRSGNQSESRHIF